MPESGDEYERLKCKMIQETQDSLDLEKIKSYFKSDINSKRALSRVKSLDDIFRLLEMRDILHFEKVTALRYVGELLKNQEIINSVKLYEKFLTEKPCLCGNEDMYLPSVQHTTVENAVLELRTNTDEPLQLAISNIAENIGPQWRILASELEIPECHIDEIREKYPSDFSKQALKALEIWLQYNDSNATLKALETALEARMCQMKGIGLHMLKPVIKLE